MKKSSLGRMYDQLTAEERFRLLIEALARGDEQEAERLTNTCPRMTCKRNDPAFGERFRASHIITMYVCAELLDMLGMLRTIEAYQEAVKICREALSSSSTWAVEEAALSYHQGWDDGCDHAWRAAGKLTPFPWNDKANLKERAKKTAERTTLTKEDKAREDPLASLEDERQAVCAWGQTVWEAFSRFCREQTELEPETMLRACFPVDLGLPEEIKETIGSVQATPESIKDYEAMLIHGWRTLVEN